MPHTFTHEKLDVYRLPLRLMEWFVERDPLDSMSARLFRKLDGALTSMILNVAEGNGGARQKTNNGF